MRRADREVTDVDGMIDIIDHCKVCHIALMDGEWPYIVAMNFAYSYENDQLVIYLHSAKEGKKLDLIRKNPEVGFEMDGRHELMEGDKACQYSYYFASVIGKGKAVIVEDPEEKLCALEKLMKHQTGKDFSEFRENPRLEQTVGILKVEADIYTCKKHEPAKQV